MNVLYLNYRNKLISAHRSNGNFTGLAVIKKIHGKVILYIYNEKTIAKYS